jgi:hypothetical protein
MRIRHTRGHGVRIDGTAGELESLRQKVLALADEGQGAIALQGEAGFDPAPYDSAITSAALTVGPGATLVEVKEGTGLGLSASPENLRRFAALLDVPEDAGVGWHAHYKYFEGTEYILPASEPVLIVLRPPEAA